MNDGPRVTMVSIQASRPWSFFIPGIVLSQRWVAPYNALCLLGLACLLVSTAMFLAKADNSMMIVLNGAGLLAVSAHFLLSAGTRSRAERASVERPAVLAQCLFAAALINGFAAYQFLF